MSSSLIKGEKAAINGMVTLFVLGLLKFGAGLATGMTVIIADSISTFADTLGVFAAYLGLRLSRKNADQHFKYGYYKIETFMALLISLGIIYVGYLILIRSVDTFLSPPVGQNRIFAITISLIAIVSSFFLYRQLKKAGVEANSLALIASANDKKMDIFAGIAVFVSVIANYRGTPYIEGIVSGIISILILKVGISSAKESLFFLLDYWNDPILSRKIKKVLYRDRDLILSVKKLKLRRAGTFIFGQAFVEINPFAGMQDLREELNFLQNKIQKLNPYIKDFVIYSHIPSVRKVKIAVPIISGNDLKARVAATLKSTNAYLFAEIDNNKVQKFYIKKLKLSEKKPVQLSNFLKNEKVNVIIDNRLSSLIYYNLRRTHHVLIYPNFSDVNTVNEALQLFLIDE